MKDIEIKNLRTEKPKFPWDVKADRTSVLGNPFYMPSELSRKDVCKLYDNYFYRMMNGASPNHAKFKAEVLRLKELYKKHGKLRLFCWCAPKQCHVKTIKTWLEESL